MTSVAKTRAMTLPAMLTTDPRQSEPRFYGTPMEIVPDVFMHPVFVNTYAVRTPSGLLLIDPGLAGRAAKVHAAIRAWSSAPVHTVVHTHGHADHAFGWRRFSPPASGRRSWRKPTVRGASNATAPCTAGTPASISASSAWRSRASRRTSTGRRCSSTTSGPRPSVTSRSTRRRLAGRPTTVSSSGSRRAAMCFAAILVIWQAPNCGNPQKVQRYPVEWATALERMAALDAECLFPGHGLVVRGHAAVRTLLLDTAAYLRDLIEQVRTRMNAGETPETIIHAVTPDPELAALPYLRATYDHPAFIVRNLLRAWGGWWDGNAANLLPASSQMQAAEIARLAGGVAPIVMRGRTLLDTGASALAAHLAEWATRADPTDRAAQTLKRDVYARRLAEEPALMAQGIFRAAHGGRRARARRDARASSRSASRSHGLVAIAVLDRRGSEGTAQEFPNYTLAITFPRRSRPCVMPSRIESRRRHR